MNGRQLSGRLKRLGLSWPVRARIVKALKIIAQPNAWIHRRRLARQLTLDGNAASIGLENDGVMPLQSPQLSKANAVVEACKKIKQRALGELSKTGTGFNNKNILSPQDYESFPELVSFATDPAIVGTVSQYLSEIPVIGTIQLWWSTENEKFEGSQLFHRDKEDFREIKIFLNIQDTTEDNGPFTYIPASQTRWLERRVPDSCDRVSDEEIAKAGGEHHIASLTGPSGTGAMVDPCRILHCGSRIRRGERLVLMVQYVPYHCIAETKDYVWATFANLARSFPSIGNDEKNRLLFDLPWNNT